MKRDVYEHPPKRGRPGISSLPLPNPRFDLTLTPGFELEADVAQEDRRRARMLRRRAAQMPRVEGAALRRLAMKIDPDETDQPNTAASSRYMRQQRIRIMGALWEVVYGH